MVVLSKIYTKTGDAGETALGNGARVAKHSLRVSAYGTVDETNATVGLARLHATGDLAEALKRISNDLFDLGADLCTPDRHLDETREYPALRMIEGQVSRLEAEIDAMNTKLTPLRSFILPGGSALGRASAPVPHRLPPGRTAGRRNRDGRGCEPRGGEIPEPPVRLVLRGRSHRQQ
jgi:cob(I)alamin adenosyltransferase